MDTLPDCMMPYGTEPCIGYCELRDEVERLRAKLERSRDELADSEASMLRRFDPAAADSTDLFTWITCLRAELAECKAELEFFRIVLYSGWTVYEELRREPKHGARTSPDNVGDTLDAIARLRKAALAAKGER